METTLNRTDAIKAAQEKLAALGFKKEKQIGMNVLTFNPNDTVLVKITSQIEKLTTKRGEEYDIVKVDNLETGETDQTMFVSGQLRHTLETLKDGYITGKFAITHLGKDPSGEYNQFSVMAIDEVK